MRFIIRAGFFLAALLAGTRLLTGLPTPPDAQSNRLALIAEYRDEYDLIFVGSSRTLRGIIPSVFDARMAKHGHSIRSLNFSDFGMREREANVYLKRIIAMGPAKLRWAIVETSDWTPSILPENRFSSRTIFWHDANESLAAMRSSLALDEPVETRLDLLSTHLLHFLARSTGVGRGWSRASQLAEGSRTDIKHSKSATKGRGFLPYSKANYVDGHTAESRRRYLASPDRALLPSERMPRGIIASSDVSVRAALDRQTAEVDALGVEVIHLALPRLKQSVRPTIPAESSTRSLAFDDPVAYPEFYKVKNRFDAEHLNTAGARRFSRLLADLFAERFVD